MCGETYPQNTLEKFIVNVFQTRRRLEMETLSELLALCGGNPLGVPSHKVSAMWRFRVSLNKLLNKRSSCLWRETPWQPCDFTVMRQSSIVHDSIITRPCFNINQPTLKQCLLEDKYQCALSHTALISFWCVRNGVIKHVLQINIVYNIFIHIHVNIFK